jgi:hypothetical protein
MSMSTSGKSAAPRQWGRVILRQVFERVRATAAVPPPPHAPRPARVILTGRN